MNKKIIIASVSGGRSSAMMAYHLSRDVKYREYEKRYIFANTGAERPETIDFLRDMRKYWGLDIIVIEGWFSVEMGVGIKHVVKSLDNLSVDAQPFEWAIKHKTKGIFEGLPNMRAPYCSGALKSDPINSYVKTEIGKDNTIMAIGFRAEDMPKRISFPEIEAKKDKYIYPLLTDFEQPVNLAMIDEFYSTQPFDLKIHSNLGNCEMCWKKSDRKIIDDIKYGTRLIDWYRRMEAEHTGTMFRGNRSIDWFVEQAKQPTLYDEWDSLEDGCICEINID